MLSPLLQSTRVGGTEGQLHVLGQHEYRRLKNAETIGWKLPHLANLFTVEDYYRRILDLYFTLRKQREHNFPELKTRFKISTGSGQNLFKINSQSCFEVFCGTGVYAMAYDAPISAALRSLANIYNAIRSNNMGDQVARALYFSRLSGPSRTSADNVENVLLLNPDLYANFRILVAETCLHSNLSVADMIIDYFLS